MCTNLLTRLYFMVRTKWSKEETVVAGLDVDILMITRILWLEATGNRPSKCFT